MKNNNLYSIYLTDSDLKLFSERSRAGWKEAWRGRITIL